MNLRFLERVIYGMTKDPWKPKYTIITSSKKNLIQNMYKKCYRGPKDAWDRSRFCVLRKIFHWQQRTPDNTLGAQNRKFWLLGRKIRTKISKICPKFPSTVTDLTPRSGIFPNKNSDIIFCICDVVRQFFHNVLLPLPNPFSGCKGRVGHFMFRVGWRSGGPLVGSTCLFHMLEKKVLK